MILIPISHLEITPNKQNFRGFDKTEVNIKIKDVKQIKEGSSCQFKINFNSEKSDFQSSKLKNNGLSTYLNNKCQTVIPKQGLDAKLAEIQVRINTENNIIYGLDFSLSNNLDEYLLPENFNLPKNLFQKPQVEIILQKEDLQIGDKTKSEVLLTNQDNFPLKNFEVTTEIPNLVAEINCNSVFLKQLETEAEKQVLDCQTNKISAKFTEIPAKSNFSLVFDIEIKNEGNLEMLILTDLDQKNLTKPSQLIKIIPKNPNTATKNMNYNWIYLLLAGFAGISMIMIFVFSFQKKTEESEIDTI